MKVVIETQDPQTLDQLNAVIQLAKNYQGNINATSNFPNGDHVVTDNLHKRALLTAMGNVLPFGYIIGSGSGHIYVSIQTGCDVEHKMPISVNGIHDRVLLIVDEK